MSYTFFFTSKDIVVWNCTLVMANFIIVLQKVYDIFSLYGGDKIPEVIKYIKFYIPIFYKELASSCIII